jgi:hypothetical protein
MGMPGIGDIGGMLGMFSIGILMPFMSMEAQQSLDWVAGAPALIME